jgi:hypothetical protein
MVHPWPDRLARRQPAEQPALQKILLAGQSDGSRRAGSAGGDIIGE